MAISWPYRGRIVTISWLYRGRIVDALLFSLFPYHFTRYRVSSIELSIRFDEKRNPII